MKRPAPLFLPLLLLIAIPSLAANSARLLPLPKPSTSNNFYDRGDVSEARVRLGENLFFDKILSGNRNISCSTCHHPQLGSADGVALAFGEGALGRGQTRTTGSDQASSVPGRVPRNAPALFNLGAAEFTRLFHDGRVEIDPDHFYDGGFITPAKWKLPQGLENVLAAQAMFPVSSGIEMAGQRGENPVADAVAANNAAGPGGVWELLADRLREIPEYVSQFRMAFPDQIESADDIQFVHAANAIAAFETVRFRADNSPFDRYLSGDLDSLKPAAKRGMELFYGQANCHSCHAGTYQTDHDFHAIAMPQRGPGKADGKDAAFWRETGVQAFVEDLGRGRVTVRSEDDYAFRTPSLRNVALTGPWGHAGAYSDLEDVVRHHLDPARALESYDPATEPLPALTAAVELTGNGSAFSQNWLSDNRLQALLTQDDWVQNQEALRGKIAAANELTPISLSDDQVADLIVFLQALTDPTSHQLRRQVPRRVPSGLPVAD